MNKFKTLLWLPVFLLAVISIAYATWSDTLSGVGPNISQRGVTYTQTFTWNPGSGTKILNQIQYEWHANGGACMDGNIPPAWKECRFPDGISLKLCFKTTTNCVNVSTAEGWYANTAFAGQTFDATSAKIYLKWFVSGTGSLSPVITGETNYASANYYSP